MTSNSYPNPNAVAWTFFGEKEFKEVEFLRKVRENFPEVSDKYIGKMIDELLESSLIEVGCDDENLILRFK